MVFGKVWQQSFYKMKIGLCFVCLSIKDIPYREHFLCVVDQQSTAAGSSVASQGTSAGSAGPTFADVTKFIEEHQKPNTVKATARDVKKFTEWLYAEKFELRNIEDIEAPELNELLAQYLVFVKKEDGGDYHRAH
jgi:hypothetical protein